MTTWKQLADIDGDYSISSDGRLRNNLSGVIRKPRRNKQGYVMWRLTVNGRRKELYAHRLVAAAFLPPSTSPLVLHANDIKDDNRVENLRWGDERDNWQDAKRNGRAGQALVARARCRNGHETAQYAYFRLSAGSYACRACDRDNSLRFRRGAARSTP